MSSYISDHAYNLYKRQIKWSVYPYQSKLILKKQTEDFSFYFKSRIFCKAKILTYQFNRALFSHSSYSFILSGQSFEILSHFSKMDVIFESFCRENATILLTNILRHQVVLFLVVLQGILNKFLRQITIIASVAQLARKDEKGRELTRPR